MTQQQIKDDAPLGATHYLVSNNIVKYYKNDNGFLVYNDGWFRLAFIGKQQAKVQLAYLAMMIKPL